MKGNLLKKATTLSTLLVGMFLFPVFSVNAQPVTNNILGALTPELATSLWRECRDTGNSESVLGDANSSLGDSCSIVRSGISVSCSRDASLSGDKCTYDSISDNSRIVADPNLLYGSTFINYDSSGTEVGRATQGQVVNESSGTLAGTTGFDVSGTDGVSCDPLNFACNLLRLPSLLLTGIASFILTLAAMILMVAGVVFNFVVIRTVFQFGEFFGTSDAMLTAWGIIRDISNIGLLFAFIFIGVMLILNVGGGGHHGGGISAKKSIPRLILFAVLINFSLFTSQFVIDVANAFASSLETLAGTACAESDKGGGPGFQECINQGISGKIVQIVGISGIWDERDSIANRPTSYAVSIFMLALFVLITAIVLLAGAVMLIVRVVTLSFLMITSPIGFAGMVIPKMQGVANMWWDKLISQSFFAPVYLLLIFMSIKLTEGLMGNQTSLANALLAPEGSGVSGNLQVVMVYLIVIGFMIGSLLLANKMGAIGASFATNAASSLVLGATARGTNLAVGGSARALRYTLQNTPGIRNTTAAKRLTGLVRPLETMNLDVRNMPGVAGVLKAGGVTTGAASAGHASFADISHQFSDIKDGVQAGKFLNEIDKKYDDEQSMAGLQRTHGHNLNQSQKDLLGGLSVKDLVKLHGIEAFASELSTAQFDALMKGTDITDEQKAKLKKNRVDGLVNAAGTMSMKDMESALKNSNFTATDQNTIRQAKVASLATQVATMTTEEFESITKNSSFTPADIDNLRTARFATLTGVIAANNPNNIANEVKALSEKDLASLPSSIVTNPAFLAAISDKQRDVLSGSSNRTAGERTTIKNSYSYAQINQQYNTAGGGQAAGAQAAADIYARGMSAGQVAKLSPAILANPQVAGAITPEVLEKLNAENLSIQQRTAIGNNVRQNNLAMTQQMQDYLAGPQGALW